MEGMIEMRVPYDLKMQSCHLSKEDTENKQNNEYESTRRQEDVVLHTSKASKPLETEQTDNITYKRVRTLYIIGLQ
jgi:hypothetical protein